MVGCNAGGNYFLSLGMRSVGETVSFSPLAYLRAMANAWVMVGIVLLVAWLVFQLSLLSWADLTFVLPITASSYVLAALLGAIWLGEHVSLSRWAGILLIFGGVALVSRTKPRTAPTPDREEEP
ncbi:MAG: DMT family transporter [Acidobacteriia bacterium]|nr:DMT family transporter [Terriglobia bacterium]